MGVLGANFKVPSFLSIDAVGPGFLESIIRIDHWWHLPKMAGRFVDKLETNLFLDFIVDIRVSLPPKVRGRVWAPTFACFAFFTVATVGPTKLCASHKLTKGDTCRKVLNNSSGNPVNIGS
jgi:hypothetical protein